MSIEEQTVQNYRDNMDEAYDLLERGRKALGASWPTQKVQDWQVRINIILREMLLDENDRLFN